MDSHRNLYSMPDIRLNRRVYLRLTVDGDRVTTRSRHGSKAVPVHFYHLCEAKTVLKDQVGVLLADGRMARSVASRHIRDLVAGEIRSNGVVDLDRRLQVCQPTDRELFVIAFEEAVSVRPRKI
ncbi:MAG: hypothetical protein J0J06_00330 [Sphingomonas sp.]|nr:hypothetical protein [Sphingomonas sp.]